MKSCCSCGTQLWVEQMIIQKLGCSRDTKIDLCLECQTKAFHAVLNELIDSVPDAKIRRVLRGRWNRVATTAETGAAVLDN